MASLVIGFIICQVAFIIPISFGEYIDNICIVFSSTLLGFVLAKIVNWKKIDSLLEYLEVRRTVNTYLWNDLMDNEEVMQAKVTINNIIYEGKIHLIEELSNNPHIVLAECYINGKKNDDNEIVILDTSKASEIIIEYDKDSPMIEKIKFL